MLTDNGGGIFLWQNSNRYCSDASDGVCTLVDGGSSGPFTVSACKANISSASVNTATYTGNMTGSPSADWWNGCIWRTENVSVTQNTIDFNPANIMDCNRYRVARLWCWSASSASTASPPDKEPGWVVPTQLTFFQNNTWSDNVYNGPSTFFAWNQGNGENPVSWADWTDRRRKGRQVRFSLRAAERLLHRSIWPGCRQHLPQRRADHTVAAGQFRVDDRTARMMHTRNHGVATRTRP